MGALFLLHRFVSFGLRGAARVVARDDVFIVMARWQMKLSIAELTHNPLEFVKCPDISPDQSKIW